MATAILSSGVCTRLFSLTIKQYPHQKKDVRKYASIQLSSTFYVFESHHGPVNPGEFLYVIVQVFARFGKIQGEFGRAMFCILARP